MKVFGKQGHTDGQSVWHRRYAALLLAPLMVVAADTAYAQCGPDYFTSTGTMSVAREYARGVALYDGRAMIVGGANTVAGNKIAEIYNPTTSSFSQVTFADNLNNATLAVMNGGTVAISGGDGNDSIYTFQKTIFYRPWEGTTYFAYMMQPRRYHTVTPLQNGKLLIVGGETRFYSGYETATAEIYDPATGAFNYTGSMATPRKGHTATLLNSGKVLVVSGSTAEIYDPATGTFSTISNPAYPRRDHTATRLLDGRVLLAGGRQSSGTAYGNSEAELFDPYTNTFTRLTFDGLAWPAMNGIRVDHTATLLPNGKVLLAGGHNLKSTDRYYSYQADTTELFDPLTNRFTWGPAMTRRRSGHTTVLLNNGRLLVAGGFGYYYTGTWTWLEPQNTVEWTNSGYCTGGTSLGCYGDDNNRALPVQLIPNGATVDSCIAVARTRGYPYVGLQNGGACYAGFAPAYSYDSNQGDCNMNCTANVAQRCGGAWHNNIWSTGIVLPVIPDSRRYGCFYDDTNRDLDALLIPSGATRDACVAAAAARGFQYAALQAGGQCFAGNAVTYASRPGECGMACTANPGQTCGNNWRNEVFTTNVFPPTVSYTGRGCFSDDNNRALPARLIGSGATIESCTAAAKQMGYRFAGLQWQGQCWASAVLGYGAANGACTTMCTAKPSQNCGGNFANNVFEILP